MIAANPAVASTAASGKEEPAFPDLNLFQLPHGYEIQTLVKNGKVQSTDGVQPLTDSTEKEEYLYYFEDSDLDGINWREDPYCYKYEPPVPTFSELMEEVGSDGAVVIGSAQGTREAHLVYDESEVLPITLTTLSITQVLHGDVPGTEIQIGESYALCFERDQGNCLYYTWDRSGPLRNGKEVLVFLKKDAKGFYSPIWGYIPLQQDHAFSSDALHHLLAYYRGDHSEYKYQESTEIPLNDGTRNSVGVIAEFWPTEPWSDERTLDVFSENVLVQIAAQFHVIVWPTLHRNYEKQDLFSVLNGYYSRPYDIE